MIIDRIEIGGKVKEGYTNELVRFIVCDGKGDNGCRLGFDNKDGEDVALMAIGELKTPVGVGNKPDESDKDMKPGVIFAFNNEESIDVVIHWLEETKKALRKEIKP